MENRGVLFPYLLLLLLFLSLGLPNTLHGSVPAPEELTNIKWFRGFFSPVGFLLGIFFFIKLVFLFILIWVYFILFLIVRAGERTHRWEGGRHEDGWVERLGGVERGEIHDQILLYEEHFVIQIRYFVSAISSLENKIRDFLCTGSKQCLRN